MNEQQKGDQSRMRKLFATLTIFFLFAAPLIAEAAANCPQEVQAAKDMLKLKQTSKANGSEQFQAPRTLAGASSRESESPRAKVDRESQAPRVTEREAQAPRAKVDRESQAPRVTEREAQAPRAKVDRESQAPRVTEREAQAPRTERQDAGAPRTVAGAPQLANARILIDEAEAACKAGDMTKASEKAQAAIEILK